LLSVGPNLIKNIKVETTIVNGEIVFSHEDFTRGEASAR